MVGLVILAIVYAVVCSAVTAAWVLVQGSPDNLRTVLENPRDWKTVGFWPIWIVLGWGAALLIHAGAVLTAILFGGQRRAEKRRLRAARIEAKVQRALRAEPGPAQPAPERSPPESSRQWVTVMFVDIAGSTTLNEELGDEAWSRFLVGFRELIRHNVVFRSGSEVGTRGDGLLASYPSPADAVLSPVDIQREVGAKLTEPRPLSVRIGVDAGEAVHDDGDLSGRVIDITSRVTSEAASGEILVTEPVAEYVDSRLRLEDRGVAGAEEDHPTPAPPRGRLVRSGRGDRGWDRLRRQAAS